MFGQKRPCDLECKFSCTNPEHEGFEAPARAEVSRTPDGTIEVTARHLGALAAERISIPGVTIEPHDGAGGSAFTATFDDASTSKTVAVCRLEHDTDWSEQARCECECPACSHCFGERPRPSDASTTPMVGKPEDFEPGEPPATVRFVVNRRGRGAVPREVIEDQGSKLVLRFGRDGQGRQVVNAADYMEHGEQSAGQPMSAERLASIRAHTDGNGDGLVKGEARDLLADRDHWRAEVSRLESRETKWRELVHDYARDAGLLRNRLSAAERERGIARSVAQGWCNMALGNTHHKLPWKTTCNGDGLCVTHYPEGDDDVAAYISEERERRNREWRGMGGQRGLATQHLLQHLGYRGDVLTTLWADVERTAGLGNKVSTELLRQREAGEL